MNELNLKIPPRTHNFIVCGADTDSIMFCKPDQTPFSEDEQEDLLVELNELFPSDIKWEHDGVFPKVIYVKAKNYILFDGKTVKYKGSSLKATTLEPRMKEFMNEVIHNIIYKNVDYLELVTIYNKYVKEACNVTDIRPWCSRKTISQKTLTSTRTNETQIKDAISDTEHVEGDRVWVYYTPEGVLKLSQDFEGTYSQARLLSKLHNAADRFKTILPVKDLFQNYALTRNQKQLCQVIGREINVSNTSGSRKSISIEG